MKKSEESAKSRENKLQADSGQSIERPKTTKRTRDDFTQPTIRTLAMRVNFRCSRCGITTVGPHSDPHKAKKIGEAAHIEAAAGGGARANPKLSEQERKDINNGIWLCGNCHTIIDRDEKKFTVEYLRKLKQEAEQRADEELGVQMPRVDRSTVTPPLQRPERAEHFTGREKELDELLDKLQPERVVTLCAPGGMGKTALAAEAVWTLAPKENPLERFPDGVIFHSFYNQPQVQIALEKIALAYGEETRPTPAEAARHALGGKCALLILDGVENADDLPAVLAVRDRCGVLITTRDRQDAPGERIDLKPLEARKAVQLLQSWAGEYASDDAAAREICRRVGYLPLAVRLVGRYLERTGEEAQDYLAWLEETPLEALDQGERQQQSVPLLLERSLTQVSENARMVVAVAGVLALDSFDDQTVAAALDQKVSSLRPDMAELLSYGLLQREGKRFSLSHALIHTYSRGRRAPTSQVVQRLADYFDDYTRTQSAKGPRGYIWLDLERVHLMNLVEICVERGEWKAAIKLVWAVEGYLSICCYWTERMMTLKAGIEAAQHLEDRRSESAFWGNLGNVYCDIGKVENAIEYYQQALTIAQEIRHRGGEGSELGHLGLAYYYLGKMEKAIEYYQQALEITQDIGDRRGEGLHLSQLGNAYRDIGNVENAIEHYHQALEIAQEIGDRRAEGSHLDNLGQAYYGLGQVEKAIECHQQALEIAQEIGYRRNEGAHLGNLGIAYRTLGQVEKAIEYYKQALAIAQEIGDRRNEGAFLGNLGLAYSALGQVEKAIECYQQGLAIAQEIGDRRNEGAQLINLGLAFQNIRQVERAKAFIKAALTIFEEIKSPHTEQARRILEELEEGIDGEGDMG